MAIAVQGEYCRLVSQKLLHDFYVGPGADRKGRAGMPQVMEPQPTAAFDSCRGFHIHTGCFRTAQPLPSPSAKS
jgi:hypothetical protein